MQKLFNNAPIQPDATDIKRFLLVNGFNDTLYDVMEVLSTLAAKSMYNDTPVMEKEYSSLASRSVKNGSLRAKLGYYIKKNYNRVRKNIKEKYDYDIGEYYTGVKNFVEQIAIAYGAFFRDL